MQRAIVDQNMLIEFSFQREIPVTQKRWGCSDFLLKPPQYAMKKRKQKFCHFSWKRNKSIRIYLLRSITEKIVVGICLFTIAFGASTTYLFWLQKKNRWPFLATKMPFSPWRLSRLRWSYWSWLWEHNCLRITVYRLPHRMHFKMSCWNARRLID